jgi:hypothetical protein
VDLRRLCLLGALTVLTAACGSEAVDLSDAREPGSPPAYWLGEEFEGLALVADAGSPGRPTFVYGTCEPPPESESGCAPPLQLQHWPLSARQPGMFEIAPGRRTSCRVLDVRGITAATFETTGGVEVYLGDRVVVLFGRPELIRKAMTELRPVRSQEPALPPPAASALEGIRRCAPPAPETKLRELRAAGGPVYWLGTSFEGHPLATAEGDAEEVSLVYGSCAREELAFDGRCWPPLELRVMPLHSPEDYHESVKCRLGRAGAAATALLPGAATLDVYAGARTIRLIGPDLDALQRAAARLRRLDEAEPTPLPAPPADVVERLRALCA